MITYWIFISVLLCLGYLALQYYYVKQWQKIEQPPINSSSTLLSVAIIIPARNEAENIVNLLASINQQDYPKSLIEIIVVDDFSEDETVNMSHNFLKNTNLQYQILHLKDYPDLNPAYKKSAIEYAVSQTQQELIITTDADCIVPKFWVKLIAQTFVSTQANLIASPVALIEQKPSNIFNRFECLDFCGMQLITGASIQAKIFNMANGANLAYKKSAFLACDGYRNIDGKASGDDMLLIHKIAQLDATKIYFLKDNQVITKANSTSNIKEFLHQRFRWTSKATAYQDKRITIMLALVLFFCISIVLNLIFAILFPIYFIVFPNNTLDGLLYFLNGLVFGVLFVFQISIKTIIDYYLLSKATQFFNSNHLKKHFWISEYLHVLYIVFVGLLGNFVPSNWKGRTIR